MEIIYKIDDFPNPGDQDVYRGIQEINRGDYQEAQKYFEKGSKYDNEYASLFNALHYYTGFGFAKRDPSKSMNLFKKIASEWNNPVAQYLLGAMYFQGDKGISQHGKHAMKWLTLAAENNWADAMVLLGSGCKEGTLFKKDEKKALGWFQKVSQKDSDETEPIDDGILYLFGNKAFELRLEPSVIFIVKSTIDQEVFPPAHYFDPLKNPITAEWCQQLNISIWSILTNKKSRGVIPSQLRIGTMHSPETADTLPANGPKSTYFFKKAAKNGNGEACMALGLAYEFGRNGIQDCLKAVEWYKLTLERHGDIEAAYRIGVIFYNGKDVLSNSKVALDYFKLRLSDSDHGSSHLFTGDIYKEGKDGVPQDYTLARQHFEKSFDCGELRGAMALAEIYNLGLGVRADREKAKEWITKAMTTESTLAQTPPIVRLFRMSLQ